MSRRAGAGAGINGADLIRRHKVFQRLTWQSGAVSGAVWFLNEIVVLMTIQRVKWQSGAVCKMANSTPVYLNRGEAAQVNDLRICGGLQRE